MTILVLDGGLVGAALAELADDELMIVVDPSADRLEELEERYPDPRVTWLIGDGDVIPIPDRSVDRVLGDGTEAELARVLRS
jgi:ubiquinone/menaquinone biosynthesis C-methylase UbiE